MTWRKFNLERVEVPQWVEHIDDREAADRLGEQREWGFAIPWTHQALANPKTRTPFVRAPKASESFWPIALGYWEALLHLLVYGFGWSRPDLGLQWWYDNGRPTDDRKLALLDELWYNDGQLDWFAAWLWTTGARDYLHHPDDHPTDRLVEPDPGWLDQIRLQVEAAETPSPYSAGGDTDPLHLAHHAHAPLLAAPPYGAGRLQYDQTGKRQATLVLDSMTGWYRALSETAASLVSASGPPWAVDVIVTAVGHLGRFRHSRRTGLWYSGRHRHHLVGN